MHDDARWWPVNVLHPPRTSNLPTGWTNSTNRPNFPLIFSPNGGGLSPGHREYRESYDVSPPPPYDVIRARRPLSPHLRRTLPPDRSSRCGSSSPTPAPRLPTTPATPTGRQRRRQPETTRLSRRSNPDITTFPITPPETTTASSNNAAVHSPNGEELTKFLLDHHHHHFHNQNGGSGGGGRRNSTSPSGQAGHQLHRVNALRRQSQSPGSLLAGFNGGGGSGSTCSSPRSSISTLASTLELRHLGVGSPHSNCSPSPALLDYPHPYTHHHQHQHHGATATARSPASCTHSNCLSASSSSAGIGRLAPPPSTAVGGAGARAGAGGRLLAASPADTVIIHEANNTPPHYGLGSAVRPTTTTNHSRPVWAAPQATITISAAAAAAVTTAIVAVIRAGTVSPPLITAITTIRTTKPRPLSWCTGSVVAVAPASTGRPRREAVARTVLHSRRLSIRIRSISRGTWEVATVWPRLLRRPRRQRWLPVWRRRSSWMDFFHLMAAVWGPRNRVHFRFLRRVYRRRRRRRWPRWRTVHRRWHVSRRFPRRFQWLPRRRWCGARRSVCRPRSRTTARRGIAFTPPPAWPSIKWVVTFFPSSLGDFSPWNKSALMSCLIALLANLISGWKRFIQFI